MVNSVKYKRLAIFLCFVMAILMCGSVFAFAEDTTGEKLIMKIIGIICTIARIIGILMLVIAAIQLISSLKNENPDGRSQAIMLIAVGISLVLLSVLVAPIVEVLLPGHTIPSDIVV